MDAENITDRVNMIGIEPNDDDDDDYCSHNYILRKIIFLFIFVTLGVFILLYCMVKHKDELDKIRTTELKIMKQNNDLYNQIIPVENEYMKEYENHKH